jgi:hypothetical protein
MDTTPVRLWDSRYARRRAKAITKHLSAIAETSAELLGLFDNWLAPSVGLRQYLWAHRRESIETARKLIELIPPVVLKTVLGYLVLNYWEHRSGWPDLLVYRENQWFLAEGHLEQCPISGDFCLS